jgi:hypothetical protein
VASKHVVRLAPGMLGFYDPVNRLHLMYPNKMVGELPLDADLTYIRRAVKSGRLVDVSGTITGSVAVSQVEPKSDAAAQPEAPAPAPAVVEEPVAAVQEVTGEPEEAEVVDAGAAGQEEEEQKKQGRKKR